MMRMATRQLASMRLRFVAELAERRTVVVRTVQPSTPWRGIGSPNSSPDSPVGRSRPPRPVDRQWQTRPTSYLQPSGRGEMERSWSMVGRRWPDGAEVAVVSAVLFDERAM